MIRFLFASFFFTTAFAQSCKPGDSLGPFIPGVPCPAGSENIKGPNGGEECCPTGSVIPPQTCQPGASLGPSLPGLPCPPGSETVQGTAGDECCPTGAIIPGTTKAPPTSVATEASTIAISSTVPISLPSLPSRPTVALPPIFVGITCLDKVNPITGVSDCSLRANLCNNPNYLTVMTKQCPKTCGFCTSTTRETTSSSSSGGCIDLTNPKTGVSDCLQRKSLCNDPNYTDVMDRQCPKTCGRCGTSTATTRAGAAATETSTLATVGPCVDKTRNGRSDCPTRRNLCRDPIYETLMREQCPATCGFC